jgi:hypothetical protein
VEVLFTSVLAGLDAQPALNVPKGTLLQFSDKGPGFARFPGYRLLWDFGNGDTSSLQNPSYTYPEAGNYVVTLYVQNAASCSDTMQLNIQVFDSIVIPNSFSPNGDGINDVFQIQNLEFFPNSQLWIYSRWGNLIYSG